VEDSEVAALNLPRQVVEEVAIESRYEGYLARQEREISQFRNLEHIRIPTGWIISRSRICVMKPKKNYPQQSH